MYPSQPPTGYRPTEPLPGNQMPYPPPGYGVAPSPPVQTTNGFAIASLILGIVALGGIGIVLAIVFGIVALKQIKQRGQRGRGLAIGGMIAACLWIVLFAVVAAVATITPSTEPSALPDLTLPSLSIPNITAPTVNIPGSGSTRSVMNLHVGDCIRDLNPGVDRDVKVLSCNLPHDAEVVSIFTLPDASWPGEDAVVMEANERCASNEIQAKIANGRLAEQVVPSALYPNSQMSWNESRDVDCLVTDRNKGKLIGEAMG